MAHYILPAVLVCCWALTACNEQAGAPAGAAGGPQAAQNNPVVALVEAIPLPPPPDPPRIKPVICDAAIAMVVEFEIISRAYYQKRLTKPIWPGGASGVTIGVGYDLGHQIPTVIDLDWRNHAQAQLLPAAAGVTGTSAKQLTAGMAHIITPIDLAEAVFELSTIPRYWQMTRRAYPGIDSLTPCAKGALLSLTYNRGAAMAGDRNREKRAIRDDCVPRGDNHCIAGQIQAMTRLWAGTSIETGMRRRREAEAELAVQ